MKLLALLVLLSILTISCRKELTTSKNTGYYFCYSHEKPKEESKIKHILYTEILKIERDDQVIKDKTSDWSKLVNNQCKNARGCTSDLMYYYTFEEADAMRNEILELYNNPENYQIEKLEFK